MAGFRRPTTTPAPDELFDYWLTRLSGPQLRVLLYVIRRTLGFRKNADAISLDQFLSGIRTRDGHVLDEGTGIKSRITLVKAIKGLEDNGLLGKEKRSSATHGDLTTVYHLQFADDTGTLPSRGFRLPTTTPVPDDLYDYWLTRLSDPELKAILYIIRRTLGFRKNADTISLRQFIDGVTTHAGRVLDEGCGIEHRKTLGIALDGLDQKGLIQSERRSSRERGDLTTLYVLVFEGDAPFVIAQDPRALPPDLSTGRREPGLYDRLQAAGIVTEPGGVQQMNPGGIAGELQGVQQVNPRSVAPEPHRVQEVISPSTAVELGGGHLLYPQQTDIQETVNQQTERQQIGAIDYSMGTSEMQQDAVAGKQQRRADRTMRSLLHLFSDLGRELGDEATVASSAARAQHLMEAAQVTLDDFVGLIREARSLTRANQAHITKVRGDSIGLPRKNLMPYFFATLQSLLNSDKLTSYQEEGYLQDQRSAASQIQQDAAPPGAASRPSQAITQPDCQIESRTTSDQQADAHPIWRAVLADLKGVVTADNYDTWLARTHVVAQDGHLLQVGVPQTFHRDWLDKKLRRRIESTLQRLGYAEIQVTFVVDE